MDGNTIIKYYPKDHYTSIFNQNTGLSIRKEDAGYKEPFWASHGPELLDISITNYCTKECKICYRNSHLKGKHISIENLRIILEQAKNMDVRQIALGGGNPNQHPYFTDILRIIRKEYKIIPSYTTNGIGMNTMLFNETKKYCGVVAVSIDEFKIKNYQIVEKFIEYGIKTNIHYVVTSETIEDAIKLLEGKRKIPDKLNAIIFLNYKPVGNNKQSHLKAINSDRINYFFSLINNSKLSCNIGFDSCFVSGLSSYTTINPIFYDYCEAGRFSAFIDENLNMVPCSFLIHNDSIESLKNKSMQDIWSKSKLFNDFRYKIKNHKCKCDYSEICSGGCPVFDINTCSFPP